MNIGNIYISIDIEKIVEEFIDHFSNQFSEYLTPQKRLIYHYTDLQGIDGILKTRKIWATNPYYLNDTSEINYAIEVINTVINKLINYKDCTFLREFSGYFVEKEIENIYVVSLSENDDLLSQWRGYGGINNSYAIGFDCYFFFKDLVDIGILQRVIYEREIQEDLIKFIIKKFINYDRMYVKYKDVHRLTLMQCLYEILLCFIPFIKNYSFHEEKEVRFISFEFIPNSIHSESKHLMELKHRICEQYFIPFVELNISPTDHRNNCIEEIVIGPALYPELAFKSLQTYICKNAEHPTNIKIRHSKVPYRV